MWVFLFLTVCIFGGTAFLMGQAIGETWRPMWQNVPYGILLVIANRYFAAVLFKQPAFDVLEILLDTIVIIGIALVAYRLTQARKMVAQYPWIYERTGVFTWREKATTQG
ncbi:MAG: hypothetical protein IPK59_05590 [Rhodospirillaceae bacterium]|nr:hypothetical protein [Rhodospirillaceae bacterium]